VENLFFAGRNISASHVAFGSTRVMATCAIGGQAIGTAAALLQARNAASTADLATTGGLAELRQRLARDDAFVPGVGNEDLADLARSARVTASSETTAFPAAAVLDGHTRALRPEWGPWVAEGAHAWRSTALPATLRVELPEPRSLREIHLTFDSGLDRPLVLSGSEYMTNLTVRGPQPELARHYRLRVDGELVLEETFNFLRKRVHVLAAPRTARVIELEVVATHGAPEARLHEIRLYA
jgi:hypothetical protein